MEAHTKLSNNALTAPKTSLNFEDKYDFYKYFGTVITTVFKYFLHDIQWYYKIIAKQWAMPKYFDKTNELIINIIPQWATLLQYTHGKICVHVFKMLFCVLRDPNFQKLNKYDKNVILWATLLHDIAKRGTPLVPGKDAIHPFRSGMLTLRIFRDCFKFIELSEEYMEKWEDLSRDLYMPDVTDPKKELVQDHSKVNLVKEFIDRHITDGFVKEVFWLVFLHQSLPTIRDHMSRSILPSSEMNIYFSKRLLTMMSIILINDSLSYLLFGRESKRKQYTDEINKNIEILMGYLNE